MSQIAPWLANSRWPTVPIRYVAKLGTGHTPSRQKPEYWVDCDVPWVTLADVWQLRDGTVDYIHDTKEKVSKLGLANSAAVKHPACTVILSRTASVGFSAVMGTDMATSQDFATWTCGRQLDPKFLLYVLRAMAPDLRRVAAGSTHKTIYMPDIEDLRTPLPAVQEQRRIADFLDAELARLGRIQDLRMAQRAQLNEQIQARISEAITPGMLGGKPRHARFPWLPVLPEHIPLVRLGYLSRLQSGLTVDGARTKTGDDVTRPYLRVANVQAGYVSLDSVTQITVPRTLAARSTLQPGDVLMTEGGDLDKLGRGTVWRGELPNCLHQNHIFALRVKKSQLDPDYLALVTRSVHGRCYFESTGVKTTNLASTNSSKILSFPVPLPVIDRQRAIVAELGGELETVERVRNSIDRQTERLQERRRALITAAVTGQIDVTATRGVEA